VHECVCQAGNGEVWQYGRTVSSVTWTWSSALPWRMHHGGLQEVGSTAGGWLHSLFSGAGESKCVTWGDDQHLASKVQVLRLQALPLHMYHVICPVLCCCRRWTRDRYISMLSTCSIYSILDFVPDAGYCRHGSCLESRPHQPGRPALTGSESHKRAGHG
jgi:hypothetical protein